MCGPSGYCPQSGTTSGRDLKDTDKYAQYGLETFSASEIDAPLLKGCVEWLECKLISEPHNQNTYDLFITEVVAAYADGRIFQMVAGILRGMTIYGQFIMWQVALSLPSEKLKALK